MALVNELIFGPGSVDEAMRLLSAAVATADLDALARLAGLASRAGDLSLQKTILDRAADLAASQVGSAATAPAVHAILAANLLFSEDEAYIRSILGLLDRCLDQGGPIALALPSSSPGAPILNMNPNLSAFYEFPPASPHWMSPGAVNRLVYMQLEAVDRISLLLGHLNRRAGETTGRTRLANRLAQIAVPWWRRDRAGALASLDRLVAEAPDDAGLALVLIQGYLLGGDTTRAVAVLDRADTESTPLAIEFDRVRVAISERLRTGTRDQLLDSVMLLLRSRSHEPDLGFLFGATARRAARPAVSGRLVGPNPQPAAAMGGSMGGMGAMGGMMAGMRRAVPAPSAPMVLPAGPVPTRNLDDLFEHAQSRRMLDALERAADALWQRHRGSYRLGALVTLARFARGDVAGAAEAAGRFSALVAARPDLAGTVEAIWIVGRCLDHDETASLGRKLGRAVLPAARARGMRPETIDLTIRLIKSTRSSGPPKGRGPRRAPAAPRDPYAEPRPPRGSPVRTP